MKRERVLGLDLSAVTMPEAIAAMVEAWLEAQGVGDPGDPDQCNGIKPVADSTCLAPVPASKRSDWITRAWYVSPDTAKGLKAYVNRAQEAGQKVDASDIVNDAIGRWLNAQGMDARGAASADAKRPESWSEWLDLRKMNGNKRQTALALARIAGVNPSEMTDDDVTRLDDLLARLGSGVPLKELKRMTAKAESERAHRLTKSSTGAPPF